MFHNSKPAQRKCFLRLTIVAVPTFFVMSLWNYNNLTPYFIDKRDNEIRMIIANLKVNVTGEAIEPDLGFCNQSKTDTACITKDCPKPLSPDLERRVYDVLTSSNLSLSKEQLDLVRTIADDIPESEAIMAVGCSSNHYNEMQAMFENVHTAVLPKAKDLHVVAFDLGLTKEERKMTERACKCQVVTFPFQKFPQHVSEILCYSWKILIARAVLEKAKKYVIFTDTSIRWKAENFNEYVTKGVEQGMLMFASNKNHRIPLNTKREMFDYMEEEPCAYSKFSMLTASPALYTHKPHIVRTILNPLTRCALEAACICPVKVTNDVLWCYKNITDHRCHRFDQSAISILTAKIFNNDLDTIVHVNGDVFQNKYRGIWRYSEKPNYFKSLVET